MLYNITLYYILFFIFYSILFYSILLYIASRAGPARSAQASQAFQAGSPKAAEFLRFCRHFAEILLPLVAAHLETVFGASARLDAAAIVEGARPPRGNKAYFVFLSNINIFFFPPLRPQRESGPRAARSISLC